MEIVTKFSHNLKNVYKCLKYVQSSQTEYFRNQVCELFKDALKLYKVFFLIPESCFPLAPLKIIKTES